MGTAPLRILIAEDDEDVGALVELALIGMGHHVHVVNDGAAAVRYAEKEKPDVILMDIGMPVLNGYDATKRIRDRAKIDPVIVALTSWNRIEDVARGFTAGINYHMAKPFELPALESMLDSISLAVASKGPQRRG
jgi:CheY-like chemotaxis protein